MKHPLTLLAALSFAPPTIGKLADLDPAVILAPPKGFEIGYVPIATRQELETPKP